MQSQKAAFFAAVQDVVRNAWRARQDQRLLRAMSERELHDLGVGRSEIPSLVSGAGALRNGPCNRAPSAADAPTGARR